MKKTITFNIFAHAVWQHWGMSGGDNIFINLAKNLKKKMKVNIFTWKHGYLMSKKAGLTGVNYFLSGAGKFENWPFIFLFLLRTLMGIIFVRKHLKKEPKSGKQIVYSASDFFPDLLPALIFKIKFPESFLICGFYLFAPSPFKGFRGPKLKNWLYWLSQKVSFPLIVWYADMICVTSQPDVAAFVKAGRKKEEIFVVKGGIDYRQLVPFQKPALKTYEAVYVGRLHEQKGVVELIDIWKRVVEKKPKAKLAVIGFGSMEIKMRKKIKNYHLSDNIKFLGIMKGKNRNLILQKSRIILHPSIYDSGGMAAALGLACGLPGVSFDLPVFSSYYPQGFLRAKIMNFDDFADKITTLLDNKILYKKLRKEAISQAKTWDWNLMVNRFWENYQLLEKR